jgi:hypothetical protein
MPVDPEPVAEGNVVLVDGLAVVGGEGEPRYTSHFATCPDAKRWRKR